MAFDTFTFSNFKSFGPKPQTINRKPLTLVYGPNSVGKSSLLHAMLLAGYQMNNVNPIYKNSDFAGDTLKLGENNNFIHQKNDKNICNISMKYQSQKYLKPFYGIGYYLSKRLSDESFDIKSFTYEQFIETLDNLEVKEGTYHLPLGVATLIIANSLKIDDFTPTIINHVKHNKRFFQPILEDIGLFKKKLTNSDIESIKNTLPPHLNSKSEILNPVKLLTSLKLAFIMDLDEHKLSEIDTHDTDEIKIVSHLLSALGKKKFRTNYACYDYDETVAIAVTNNEFIEKLSSLDLTDYRLSGNVFRPDGQPLTTLEESLVYIFESYAFDELAVVKKRIKLKKSSEDSETVSMADKILSPIYMKIKEHLENITRRSFYNGVEVDFKYQSHKGEVSVKTSNYLHTSKQKHSENIPVLEGFAKDIISTQHYNNLVDSLTLSIKDLIAQLPYFEQNPLVGFSRIKSSEAKIQYFSPLRHVPSKKELSNISSSRPNIESSNKTNTKPLSIQTIRDNTNIKALAMMIKFKRVKEKSSINAMQSKVWGSVEKTAKLPFLVSILAPTIIRFIKSEQIFNDFINSIKSQAKRLRINQSANSLQIWHNLVRGTRELEEVNSWLKHKLDNRYQIEIIDYKRNKYNIVFRDMQNNTLVYPQDMGLGISQILPIILASKVHKEHKIYIEQPELHLHPAMQCEIADDFIQSINERENEFIIESHSEHMLLRIMRRMRETANGDLEPGSPLALTPDDVCLLYVDHNGEHTYVNELELDEDGTLLDPWPNGFFEEGYKERFA
ncbi:DUF3696 domain-containing protein [Vibrio parahaemolyticus]